jgi:hypothetical protein
MERNLSPINDIDIKVPSEDEEGGGGDDDDRNDAAMQARYVDRRRNTPLHLACCHQPPPA